MNTGTIATPLAPERPFERLVVLEPIPNDPDESWEPYEAELKAIFGFDPGTDPDPSEWFPPDEFNEFKRYLETVRRARRASLIAEETLEHRRVMARDTAARDRLTKEHDNAMAALEAARAQQRRLDRAGLGQVRLRAEDRLGIRRLGLELPSDLSFL